MWNYKTPGIPDEEFERTEKVPITKEEVRSVQICKARLQPGQIVYDVGCGSGSISVEAALQVESSGKILAIDYDQNAVDLTKKNLQKFNLSNVSVIFGNAKEKILELEEADAIFVGGTGGDTKEIVELAENKLKKDGRIVIGIILIETLYSVLQVMGKLRFKDVDITQVTISKSRKTTTGTMMLARNPVTIISATRV
ncbi:MULTISPECIES: precorrin-6Y C5,15-methyltransferase (decarboxylating) subunit CbiT [Nitrosopumilus]|uniref:Probable cobalt-precorrin-6B C(15)-methyltransferase (decarboxylating) n=1 Tax=Nitrosopumilus piranensis TaxID=1582439 RepID=A0A0C5BTQ5_9ARCH|nr:MULTISPECIES: precorrin-6Y C5,15-methyltransferase (decarboxylating) subunit CbiT [Nitrosopumilus]AJM91539.1 putative cobalt-precorrin-6Y C(15)-methyltransferase [Nitrosopumilus piranensis]KAF6245998.1 precorrin-6Y C5,15-methyltransferase (decarboxylating) subunit CbiT [Nitrosopumilus sp. b2]